MNDPAKPRGTFCAVRTRDGEALARHGSLFFDANLLSIDGTGEPLYEVQFADGLWMLATASDLVPVFTVREIPGYAWPAINYESSADGRLTPVVSCEVWQDLMSKAQDACAAAMDALPVTRLAMVDGASGEVHLSSLRWHFETRPVTD